MRFELEQSDESLTTHSGLALIGLLLAKTDLAARLNGTCPAESGNYEISHADVVYSYLGLLAQGKSDFDHIEPFRDDPFFAKALSIDTVPSAPTLRQRLDACASEEWESIIRESSAALLEATRAEFTPALDDFIALDGDVTVFDNSNTHKEGIGLTYQKVVGYAPIFFYLGQEGYLIDLELRRGRAHSQTQGTVELIERVVRLGLSLIPAHQFLLVRLDSAHDSTTNLQMLHRYERASYIIKRNLRSESRQEWLEYAKKHGRLTEPRPGKRVWIGDKTIELGWEGLNFPLRMVYRAIERTQNRDGQVLLIPEIEIDVWWVKLPYTAETVIELYKQHGTMEQFHSEIKTELDLERLPSGKMATNSTVLHLGMFAYNMLRLIGQQSLKVEIQPLRKKVHRRRIRTVIQNLIMLAAKLVYHARAWKLSFGKYSPWYPLYRHIYFAFSP